MCVRAYSLSKVCARIHHAHTCELRVGEKKFGSFYFGLKGSTNAGFENNSRQLLAFCHGVLYSSDTRFLAIKRCAMIRQELKSHNQLFLDLLLISHQLLFCYKTFPVSNC